MNNKRQGNTTINGKTDCSLRGRGRRTRAIGASLLLIALLLFGCSAELGKPELTPKYTTSAANATHLRRYTIPEGMAKYADVDALKTARQDGDTELEDITEVYLLREDPWELSPSFNAADGEVLTVYKSTWDDERSFIIHQYPSLNPGGLLPEQAGFAPGEAINGEEFQILDQDPQKTDWEAYTIRDGWLIHLKASGFSEEEFRDALADLTVESLDFAP